MPFRFNILIPFDLLAILALLVVAYVAFGIPGIVGVVLAGILLSHI